MKHDYKEQTVLERGDERSTWKERGWVGVSSNPGRRFFFFFFFFFTDAKMQGLYVWVCVSVLFPRIEPVGKPYREVCLQTLLWPWKVLRPSSWSLLLSELALKLKVFFLLFFFKWLFLGCIEHTFNKWTKKKKKKVGYFWDLIQGPLNLESDALPTELRGPSLQGNS